MSGDELHGSAAYPWIFPTDVDVSCGKIWFPFLAHGA
jgi:hypothetical protein